MPGRASAIIASRLSAVRCTAAMALRRSSAAGLPCSLTSRLVLSARKPTRCAAMPALRAAMRASPIASARSGARSASTSVVLSTFSRMSEIEFWFRSDKQLGQPLGQPLNPVDQFRRRIEQCAEPAGAGRNYRAALRSNLGQRLAALDRALKGDFADAGEADALDLGGGALKHRRFGIDLHPHPDEFRPVRKQADLVDLPDRNALEIDRRALVQPSDALAEVDVEAFGRLVRQAGQPDDEDQQSGQQGQRHGSDKDIVRTRFHRP